jgi:cysteine synthase A
MQESDPSVWWANQLCNPDNAAAHQDGTGAEILEGMGAEIDAWVASVGTGGTLLGTAETLRKVKPDLKIAGVLPEDDQRIQWVQSGVMHKYLERFGMPRMRFLIEDILDGDLLEKVITVPNEDAKRMANRLCQEEGLFCGISSGANVCAALQAAREMEQGSRIVTVLVDRRDRYFAEYPDEHYVV